MVRCEIEANGCSVKPDALQSRVGLGCIDDKFEHCSVESERSTHRAIGGRASDEHTRQNKSWRADANRTDSQNCSGIICPKTQSTKTAVKLDGEQKSRGLAACVERIAAGE
jgi:hypothetical protein